MVIICFAVCVLDVTGNVSKMLNIFPLHGGLACNSSPPLQKECWAGCCMNSALLILVHILCDTIESLSKQMKRNIFIHERFYSLWREFYWSSYSELSSGLWWWSRSGNVLGRYLVPNPPILPADLLRSRVINAVTTVCLEKLWLTLCHIRL
jgi:hypothetical protein